MIVEYFILFVCVSMEHHVRVKLLYVVETKYQELEISNRLQRVNPRGSLRIRGQHPLRFAEQHFRK